MSIQRLAMPRTASCSTRLARSIWATANLRRLRGNCLCPLHKSQNYGIDTLLPGMKVAAVSISPVLGGKVKTVDEKAALAVKGVRQVVNVDEAVAVVADHMGAAKKGLRAAAITWDDGPNGRVSNADIVKQL